MKKTKERKRKSYRAGNEAGGVDLFLQITKNFVQPPHCSALGCVD